MMKKKEKPLSCWQKLKPKVAVVEEAVVQVVPAADKDVVQPVVRVVTVVLVADADNISL